MAGHVTQIERGESLDPTPWFDGPWKHIERLRLDTGDDHRMVQDQSETALYVIAGTGTMMRTEHQLELQAGSAITLLKNSDVSISAIDEMDILLVTLAT